jgi:hypothetical protein
MLTFGCPVDGVRGNLYTARLRLDLLKAQGKLEEIQLCLLRAFSH